MPYINKLEREDLDSWLVEEMLPQPETAGQLNYLFSLIARDYINKQGLKYQAINDIIGALEGAKMEFYRRVAAPYEDQKIVENGDVY